MGFVEDVKTAIQYAEQKADETSGGDPGTMVTASVDGRSAFVSKFKEAGEGGGPWTIGSAKLSEDYSFHLDVLTGTDIQLHSKKIAQYRGFEEKMEELGWNVNIEIDTYAY